MVANTALASRSRKSGSQQKTKTVYLLSGLCRCAHCDGAIVGGREGQQPKYSCSNRRGGACSYASVTADLLEETVIENLKSYLGKMDAESLADAYRKSLGSLRDEATEREVRLRTRLTEVKAKIKNLIKAIEQGVFFSDLQVRITELKSEESEISNAIGSIHMEAEHVIDLNAGLVSEWLQDALARLQRNDQQDVQQWLQHVVTATLDLKEKRGELAIQLPLSAPSQSFQIQRSSILRSARTILRPCRPGRILIPVEWGKRPANATV